MHTLSFEGLPDLPQAKPLIPLAEKLWEREEVVALWLGGSFARGEADVYSDVDLRVAVLPVALADWETPDYGWLFGADYVGSQRLTFGESFLHHLVLTDGTIFDLWVQSDVQPPAADATLVLGCREAGYFKQLAEASLPPDAGPLPADPATIRQVIVDFWIGSHKHRKVLGRGLDLMVTKGIEAERTALLRLWDVQATERDSGAQRLTIHTLTRMIRTVDAIMGQHALEVLGVPLTSRAEIVQAVELYRDEVARVGRDLAQTLGFVYPETLEETVRRSWQEFEGKAFGSNFFPRRVS